MEVGQNPGQNSADYGSNPDYGEEMGGFVVADFLEGKDKNLSQVGLSMTPYQTLITDKLSGNLPLPPR